MQDKELPYHSLSTYCVPDMAEGHHTWQATEVISGDVVFLLGLLGVRERGPATCPRSPGLRPRKACTTPTPSCTQAARGVPGSWRCPWRAGQGGSRGAGGPADPMVRSPSPPLSLCQSS